VTAVAAELLQGMRRSAAAAIERLGAAFGGIVVTIASLPTTQLANLAAMLPVDLAFIRVYQ